MDQRFAYNVVGIPSRKLLSTQPHQPLSTIKHIDHGSLVPKITEIVKRKLSLGAKILQIGSVSKMFRKNFSIREGEKLLCASQCSLWTTAGPIEGHLFVSTEKIAFCSERSIKTFSPAGELLKFQYKVSIPLGKLKGVWESINLKRPSNKYVEIVTVDNFEFWLMGFSNHKKILRCIHEAMNLDSLSN